MTMDELVEKIGRAIEDACWEAEVESIPGSFVPREAWPRVARAALTELEQAGYVVVPVEPTEEMIDAGWAYVHNEDAAGTWRSMLSARPKVTP